MKQAPRWFSHAVRTESHSLRRIWFYVKEEETLLTYGVRSSSPVNLSKIPTLTGPPLALSFSILQIVVTAGDVPRVWAASLLCSPHALLTVNHHCDQSSQTALELKTPNQALSWSSFLVSQRPDTKSTCKWFLGLCTATSLWIIHFVANQKYRFKRQEMP